MPSTIRWRCSSDVCSLRRCIPPSFSSSSASSRMHYYYNRIRSSNNSHIRRYHFSQGLRPPQPQQPPHTLTAGQQCRVYQTKAEPVPLSLSPLSSTLSLDALTDFTNRTTTTPHQFFSTSPPTSPTGFPYSSSSSSSNSSNSSSSSSSSSSSGFPYLFTSSSSSYLPLSSSTPSFSRKQRRHLARWLPAIMATQARSHSDDSHNHGGDNNDVAKQPHTHSHGLGHHHHHHDNVYLTSQNKNDAGVRITRLGLFCNLGMAFVKGAGGYYFNSQSMIADAWHSMTDLASDFLTLATVSYSIKQPTDRFPVGFGKVESLGSLGVSGMLLAGGVFMCMSSLETLYAHFFLDAAAAAEVLSHAHGHSHSHTHFEGPSLHAAWLAAGTVLVKEWLYRATMKVARERKSSVLASNAVHHRVDSMTGIVTLAAILGANLIHDASWLDPVGGLFISMLVIRAGWDNTWSALYELADRSIDDDIKQSVRKEVSRCLDDHVLVPDGQQHLVEVRDVGGLKSGQNYLVDIELAVPSEWTVDTTRTIEESVRHKVGIAVRGVRRVRVRFVRLDETTAKFDEFIPGDVQQGEQSASSHDHDHDHEHEHDHQNGNTNGNTNGSANGKANGNHKH